MGQRERMTLMRIAYPLLLYRLLTFGFLRASPCFKRIRVEDVVVAAAAAEMRLVAFLNT